MRKEAPVWSAGSLIHPVVPEFSLFLSLQPVSSSLAFSCAQGWAGVTCFPHPICFMPPPVLKLHIPMCWALSNVGITRCLEDGWELYLQARFVFLETGPCSPGMGPCVVPLGRGPGQGTLGLLALVSWRPGAPASQRQDTGKRGVFARSPWH